MKDIGIAARDERDDGMSTGSVVREEVRAKKRTAGRQPVVVSLLVLISIGVIAVSAVAAVYYGARLSPASLSSLMTYSVLGGEERVDESTGVQADDAGTNVDGARDAARSAAPAQSAIVETEAAAAAAGAADHLTSPFDRARPQNPDLPSDVLLESAPVGKQTRSLNCEFQSASDLAWAYGTPLTWKEIFLEVGHDPGGNPHKGFVGDSLDDPPGQLYPNGYGVYAEPIARALRARGLPAEVHYNESAIWLMERLARGHPVMVWATAGMREAPVRTWQAVDGMIVRGARGEHTYLVVGYTQEGVRVIDPWYGKRVFYDWPVFLNSWDIFDRMSVIIKGERR